MDTNTNKLLSQEDYINNHNIPKGLEEKTTKIIRPGYAIPIMIKDRNFNLFNQWDLSKHKIILLRYHSGNLNFQILKSELSFFFVRVKKNEFFTNSEFLIQKSQKIRRVPWFFFFWIIESEHPLNNFF